MDLCHLSLVSLSQSCLQHLKSSLRVSIELHRFSVSSYNILGVNMMQIL